MKQNYLYIMFTVTMGLFHDVVSAPIILVEAPQLCSLVMCTSAIFILIPSKTKGGIGDTSTFYKSFMCEDGEKKDSSK